MKLSRNHIYTNRLTAINFLRNPTRKKHIGSLDAGDGYRCCLGHMCYALQIKREKRTDAAGHVNWFYGDRQFMTDSNAPYNLREQLGLWDAEGGSDYGALNVDFEDKRSSTFVIESLAQLNDLTDATTQDIGEYLYEVIEGGPQTPFTPLSEYEDG